MVLLFARGFDLCCPVRCEATTLDVCTWCHHAGEQPQFSVVWNIEPGSIAADVRRHVEAAAAQPGGLALDGKVVLLQLPDACASKDVADALQQVVQQLLPRLECDMQLDVQVCSCVHGRCSILHCVLIQVGDGCIVKLFTYLTSAC